VKGMPGCGLVGLLCSLGFCAALVAPALAQEGKLPSGDEIMAKSIEARGGQAAIDKLKTRISKGKIELSSGGVRNEGPAMLYEAAPNKRHLSVNLEVTGKIQSGSDGQVYWELSGPNGATVYKDEEKAQKQREGTFNALVHWKDLYQKAECVAKEQIDDHS
jgi:hypothetical protein